MTTNLGRKKRKLRQRCKKVYAKAREDAQLKGIIPTVPDKLDKLSINGEEWKRR